ncbi:MAG: hypothetical protein QM767_14590 [Anaeromyxobacter sp.]
MGYEVKGTRSYAKPAAAVAAAAAEVLAALGGKAAKTSRPADGHLEAIFNKEVAGKAFMNRCQLVLDVAASGEQASLSAGCWPIDPIGKKLLFGVMGEPAKLVLDTFLARLDAALGQTAGA